MKNNSGVKLFIVIVLIAVAAYFSVAPISTGMNLGLDLQGGAQVVLQAVPDDGAEITDEDMNKLVSVLDKRVNELGVSEPVIQLEGKDRIIVELAGVDDPEEAISLIGKTAKLEFVDPNGTVILTGSELSNAYYQYVSTEPANKQHQVVLEFNSVGAQKFFEATAAFTGQIIRITLDGENVSTPEVSGPISGGVASISGGFATAEEATNIAALLRGGALPVNLDIMSKSTVGPTLGADSLGKSLDAALIGFIILFLFMIAYYRLPGTWACVSLVLYSLIVLWILNLLHATLTLTSIAGFILSVGVAVDANIIIFERIREELFMGKSLRASIESGFKRAFATIFDSNVTTLIASVVLYYFGTGTIKGFALTLSIGIIASMFTAITFTRFMLRWSSSVDFMAKPKLFGGKFFQFKFDFIGRKKIWYIVAGVAIVPGMIYMLIAGMNLGIDFTGGSILEVKYEQPVELSAVRDTVSTLTEQAPSVNEGDGNVFIIRTNEMEENESQTMVAALEELGALTVQRSERIGPIIGEELLGNARWAILIAGLLMLLYITFRFKFNNAITAILALSHDVLVILSVFTLFRIEVNSYFVAAVLTVVGYSINNTIVVFDRIRENEAYSNRKGLSEMINLSINQTLTRSVNTELAVLLLIGALFFLGGETTKDFMLALGVGLFAGFFSSVFLVGCMLNDLSVRTGKRPGGSPKPKNGRTLKLKKANNA